MEQQPKYYIVEASLLPEVFLKVAQANRCLQSGEIRTVGEATQKVGLSRSAYYKYKDNVQVYEDTASGQLCTLYMRLSDEPGVLSHVLQQLYEAGANILTVNQNIPVDTVAVVTISVEINKDRIDLDEVLKSLSAIYGVVSVKRI